MVEGGIYESCQAIVTPGDMDALLKCAIQHMEAAQATTVTNVTSYLLIISGALVFFMQAGFAMLCAGSVRKKNTQNSMLKNLLDACGAAIAYFCVGYGFAFGGDSTATGTTFIGTENFFGTGDIDLPVFFFQYTFAAASVTIVAGALAERCKMAAYLCYSFFLTGFVYPVAVHSVWSVAGFLSAGNSEPLLGIGMVDFAGSGVVHMTGGTTALISMYVLGSRRGRFYDLQTGEPLDQPKAMPGHSVSLQMLGSFILWFGWFGFNPGSALLLGNDNPYQADVAALCAVNTFLSSSTSCISALFYKVIVSKTRTGEASFDLIAAMNGTLAGLVAITAGCATMEPWAAIVTGAISGLLYLWSSGILIQLKLDDVVDAVPVHLVSGLWGVLVTGLLSEPELMRQAYGTAMHPGFFYSLSRGSADANLLGCQVIGSLFIMGWSVGTMLPFFFTLNYFGMLRSEAVEELVGLDVCYNGEEIFATSKAGSDGEDQELRGEYLDAYQDYRKAKQQEEEARKKRSKDHSNDGTNEDSSEPDVMFAPASDDDDSDGPAEDDRFFDDQTSV
ncbi:Ammonium transporter 1 member [Seminavis robusta]|uniref:Ammonium transporter n=1 Tax=Seminavis robusta TaxID=568900 RepID=A0A9N8HQM6_9STRA|nr:Ammonium transporter 1 member [Seminavis robusta]|eukprot:Sro1209_g252680.1 Ammonium transporter 1 member (560) ;mRNA; r:22174-24133